MSYLLSAVRQWLECADERIFSTLDAIRCHLFDMCGVSLPTSAGRVPDGGIDQIRQLHVLGGVVGPVKLRSTLIKRRTTSFARLDALLEILGPAWVGALSRKCTRVVSVHIPPQTLPI